MNVRSLPLGRFNPKAASIALHKIEAGPQTKVLALASTSVIGMLGSLCLSVRHSLNRRDITPKGNVTVKDCLANFSKVPLFCIRLPTIGNVIGLPSRDTFLNARGECLPMS